MAPLALTYLEPAARYFVAPWMDNSIY